MGGKPEINWKATTPEMSWFNHSCAVATQPGFASLVGSWRNPEDIAERIKQLEESAVEKGPDSQWPNGAIVVVIVQNYNLYKALKLRNWRMVTQFRNPAHPPGNIVSMWYKPLVEEIPEPEEVKSK